MFNFSKNIQNFQTFLDFCALQSSRAGTKILEIETSINFEQIYIFNRSCWRKIERNRRPPKSRCVLGAQLHRQ